MRVLHCIPHLHLGGGDRGTANLVRTQQHMGEVEARLCVFQGPRAPAERLSGIADPLLLDYDGSNRRPLDFFRFAARLRGFVREWRPQIVHLHLWPACRLATTALLGQPVRFVWHVRDTRDWLLARDRRSRFYRGWTRWLAARARPQMVAVSRAAAEYTAGPLGLDADAFAIASSGVDLTEFDPARFPARAVAQPDPPVVGFAAQFRPEKAHDVLLRACALLRDRGVEVRLALAGSGTTFEATRRLSGELGLDASVTFHGHVEDVPRFLSTLDLVVLPSTANEGLPLSVLEAMAMGIPVMATPIAGTPEIVRHGETGLLVEPGDPAALAAALEPALASRDRLASMAEKARRHVVLHHSNESVASKLTSLYRGILQETKAPEPSGWSSLQEVA